MSGLFRRSPTQWRFRHYNGSGKLLWAEGFGELGHEDIYRGSDTERMLLEEQEWTNNSVTNEGEDMFINAVLRGVTVPTAFEIALATVTPTETSTYATRNEHADTAGYAAIAVTRGVGSGAYFTAASSGASKTPTTGYHRWTASGTWTAVTAAMILTDVTTAVLVAWDPLSATRSLVNTDTLDTDFTITAA